MPVWFVPGNAACRQEVGYRPRRRIKGVAVPRCNCRASGASWKYRFLVKLILAPTCQASSHASVLGVESTAGDAAVRADFPDFRCRRRTGPKLAKTSIVNFWWLGGNSAHCSCHPCRKSRRGGAAAEGEIEECASIVRPTPSGLMSPSQTIRWSRGVRHPPSRESDVAEAAISEIGLADD